MLAEVREEREDGLLREKQVKEYFFRRREMYFLAQGNELILHNGIKVFFFFHL